LLAYVLYAKCLGFAKKGGSSFFKISFSEFTWGIWKLLYYSWFSIPL